MPINVLARGLLLYHSTVCRRPLSSVVVGTQPSVADAPGGVSHGLVLIRPVRNCAERWLEILSMIATSRSTMPRMETSLPEPRSIVAPSIRARRCRNKSVDHIIHIDPVRLCFPLEILGEFPLRSDDITLGISLLGACAGPYTMNGRRMTTGVWKRL